jgi:AcrR family transcriptional regulator
MAESRSRKHRPDRRSDERYSAFLAAAIEVFLERGFEKATLDEVIRRSGGSRATLYTQFGSKEGLFAAIIEEKCRQIVAALEAAPVEGGVEEVLKGFATAYMKELMTAESLSLYRLVIGESSRFPELGAAVFQAGPTAAADRLAAYLRAQVEAGALSLPDVDLAARQFIEMVKGDLHIRALMRTSDMPSRKEVATCIEYAAAIFLNGARSRRHRK